MSESHPITNKTDAEKESERIRTAIREGRFRQDKVDSAAETAPPNPELTFREFAREWQRCRGVHLVNSMDNEHRLKKMNAFILPGPPSTSLGDRLLSAITARDIEAFRAARKAQGRSPVTVNHDLKLLRKMFNWGIRAGYLNIHRRGLHAAMEKLEQQRPAVAQALHKADDDAQAAVPKSDASAPAETSRLH